MGIIQALPFKPQQADWDSWMTALQTWASGIDQLVNGLPVTKQGVTNLMEMSGSTSNAMLLYYVTSLPPAGSFDEQVIYNGQDGRIYVWHANTQIWEPTGATAFDELTGFLQSGQLLLGNQLNICTNGCFTNDTPGSAPNGWTTNASFSNAPIVVVPASSAVAGCPTANCMFLQGRDAFFTAGGGFDVKPNEQYYLEAYMGSDGSTPGMHVGLMFMAVGSSGPTWIAATAAPSGLNGWMSGRGVVSVPSWANRAQVWLQVNLASPTPSQYGNNWFTAVECVKSPATLQNYGAGGNLVIPVSPITTLLSGSFYTGYASLILVNMDVGSDAANVNLRAQLMVDGAMADIAGPQFTCAAAGIDIPLTLFSIVSSNGPHTFAVEGYSGDGSITQTMEIRSAIVLNLLK